MKKYQTILIIIFLLLITGGITVYIQLSAKSSLKPNADPKKTTNKTTVPLVPLSIAAMRQKNYPGSSVTIEQTLDPGSNYDRYIASYKSDGLKIYALLTVPQGNKPKNGWPVIIFNHGYIPPEIYQTTERYIAYTDAFSRSGYIVFKSDYRGNGNSEGKPEGAYYSPAYTTDVLNALSSMKQYKNADPTKIGMWGHSMGGNITLRSLIVDPKDIKAAVIWGGVVGSYADMMNWHDPKYHPSPTEQAARNQTRTNLTKKYGTPKTNPTFWNTIDPTAFISQIAAPIQLDYGTADEEVPPAFSQSLYERLKADKKTVEIYSYDGSDHNISQGFDLAMQRSIDFFDKYLKK